MRDATTPTTDLVPAVDAEVAPGSPWPARAASVLVAIAVLWWSERLLSDWVTAARFPNAHSWTSGWPPIVLGGLVLALVLGIVRKSSWPTLVAAICTSALFTTTTRELPWFSSNNYIGDGPFLMPIYVALILGLTLYVAAGPRRHPEHQRILLALLLACTANTKLFVRESTATVGLLLCLALLGVLTTPIPPRWREVLKSDRLARALVIGLVALVLWVFVTIFTGDSQTVGTRNFQSVLLGALMCWLVAAGLDRAGIERVVFVFLLGIASCLVIAAVGMVDTAATEGWTRTLNTRLRLFQSHPNIIGPYFASSAVFCTALLFWRRERGAWLFRLLLAVLAVGSLYALHLTQSRASQLALFAGLGVAAFVAFGPIVRRPRRLYVAVVASAALGTGFLFTPLADPIYERLEVRAFDGRSALGQRYHFWRMSTDAIASSPIFGVGPAQNYVHAQYALPSYYDGARQTHHAHNLFLYLAEGSGIPSLLIFLALVLGMVELFRRALLRLPRGDRPLVAALVAVPLGIMASNMLDLGQVQPTYLPLYFWIHIGLAAALLASTAANSTDTTTSTATTGRLPGAPVVLLATAAIVPLGMLPLIADAFITSARLRAFTQQEATRALEHTKNEKAYRDMVIGRRLFPAHSDAGTYEPPVLENLETTYDAPGATPTIPKGQLAALILDAYRRECRAMPSNSKVWLDLARRSLKLGNLAEAGQAIERALALDPRGHRVGQIHLVRTWWFLAEGRVDDARDALRLAAINQGTTWNIVPHTFEPVRRGAVTGSRRMVFTMTARNGTVVRLLLDDALTWLGERVLETAVEQPIEARRHLTALYGGYLRQNRPEDALPWLEQYRALVGRVIPSVVRFEYDILMALGRVDAATALLDSIHPDDRALLEPEIISSRILDTSARMRTIEIVDRLEDFLEPLEQRDIFFELGMHTSKFRTAALLYGRAGRWEDSVRCTRRFMRDYIDFKERRDAIQLLVRQSLIPSGMPNSALIDLLQHFLHEENVEERRTGGRSEFLTYLADHLIATWKPADGDMVEVVRERLGSVGPAGEGLVRRLINRSPASR